MLLRWKIWSIQFKLQQMTILYVTASTSPKNQTWISCDAVFLRKCCFCRHSYTGVGAFLACLFSRLHYGHHSMDLPEKASPKRIYKMFQHGGTQPWLSSTICCNTLSNLLSFLRTLNKGSKKFSSFIDTINSTTVSNTGPDENCLS